MSGSNKSDQTTSIDIESLKMIVDVVGTSISGWRSQVLNVGVRLGLFESIGMTSKTVDQLCEELNCPRHSLERLIIAAHACGFLEREDGEYRNSPHIARTLVSGQAGYVGNWLRLMSRWFNLWNRLEQAIRTGKHVEDPELHLGRSEEYTRDFICGMHDYAHYRGTDILDHLDLTGCKRLIDVGAGPGTYSIMFCKRYPDLTCTLFDLPEVLGIAKEYVDDAELADRVLFQPGNYHQDEFGHDLDLVFVSDTLHQEDEQTGIMITEKAFRALRSGGRLVVQAMFLRDDRSGPEWPALHNLLMLLTYRGGKAYTVSETIPWLERAGFVDIERVPMSVFNVNSLIVGRKP